MEDKFSIIVSSRDRNKTYLDFIHEIEAILEPLVGERDSDKGIDKSVGIT